MLKIGFLGGGNMARAIVAGLVSSGADPKLVTVMDRHPEKLAALREQFGITTQEKPGDWITALDVVVLAVKPQGLKECCVPGKVGTKLHGCCQLRRLLLQRSLLGLQRLLQGLFLSP